MIHLGQVRQEECVSNGGDAVRVVKESEDVVRGLSAEAQCLPARLLQRPADNPAKRRPRLAAGREWPRYLRDWAARDGIHPGEVLLRM